MYRRNIYNTNISHIRKKHNKPRFKRKILDCNLLEFYLDDNE